MNELSSKSRTLLDAARAARPSLAARDRMHAALAAQIGAAALGAPPQIAPAPAPVPPPPPPLAPLASAAAVGSTAKAAVLGVVLGVITVGGAAAWPTAPAPSSRAQLASIAPPPSSLAPAVGSTSPPVIVALAPSATLAAIAPPPPEPPRAASLPAVAPAPLAPRPREAPPAEARAGDAHEAPSPPPTASSIGEETALLGEAQRSLKQGDGARALAVLDQLAARHPAGVLREERLAAQVFALCAEGKTEQAREAARRFLAEMPTSVQADRVRASCASPAGK